MLAFLGWKAPGLALKAGFLAVGETRIASPEELASWREAVALVLPVEANLALHSSVLALSEFVVASLLAPIGASLLALRLKILALSSALVLTLQLRTILALSAGSGSEAILASLTAHRGALDLALRDKRG